MFAWSVFRFLLVVATLHYKETIHTFCFENIYREIERNVLHRLAPRAFRSEWMDPSIMVVHVCVTVDVGKQLIAFLRYVTYSIYWYTASLDEAPGSDRNGDMMRW